jgi:hypothetical protein
MDPNGICNEDSRVDGGRGETHQVKQRRPRKEVLEPQSHGYDAAEQNVCNEDENSRRDANGGSSSTISSDNFTSRRLKNESRVTGQTNLYHGRRLRFISRH